MPSILASFFLLGAALAAPRLQVARDSGIKVAVNETMVDPMLEARATMCNIPTCAILYQACYIPGNCASLTGPEWYVGGAVICAD